MDDQLLSHIRGLIGKSLTEVNNENMFDRLIRKFQNYYDRPVHSLTEMRNRDSTKVKGDIFEHFCWLYLTHCYAFRQERLTQVWLLKDLPIEIRQMLNLASQDLGIDLIGVDSQGRYYAIQAKYRKHNAYKQKTGIPWRQLSTFYALAIKTGPYHKHVIMTNVDYVRHVGKKTPNDQSICLGSMRKITYSQWLAMSGSRGELLGDRDPVLCGRVIHPEHPAKLVINDPSQSERSESSGLQIMSEEELIRRKRLERFG